jgi:hypothetical protein
MSCNDEMRTGAYACDPLREGCTGTGSSGLKSATPMSNKFDGNGLKDPSNQADSNSFAGYTAGKQAFIGEG